MKYRIKAHRLATSMFGEGERWCQEDGKVLEFPTREAAEQKMRSFTCTSRNINYSVEEYHGQVLSG